MAVPGTRAHSYGGGLSIIAPGSVFFFSGPNLTAEETRSCCYRSLPLVCCFLCLEDTLPSRVLPWQAVAPLGSRAAAHALPSSCPGRCCFQPGLSQLGGHRPFWKLHSLWAEQPIVGINTVRGKQPVTELKTSNVRSSCRCVAERHSLSQTERDEKRSVAAVGKKSKY